MSQDFWMSIGSISLSKKRSSGPCSIFRAAQHNKREIAEELHDHGRIDVDRLPLNYCIDGALDAAGVNSLALQLMAEVGSSTDKMRRDYCQAIEVIFSLPATTSIATKEYFTECVEWCRRRFGSRYILSADVHMDESSPHMHVLIAPIKNGRWVGFNALIGNKEGHQFLVESFERDLAKPYGLSIRKKLRGEQRALAIAMVLEWIETCHSALIATPLWQPTRKAIERSPEAYIEALGMTLPDKVPPKQKTMAQIFTSPGKGPKREPQKLPYQKAIAIGSEEHEPVSGDKAIAIDHHIEVTNKAASKAIAIEYSIEKEQRLPCEAFTFPQQTNLPKKEALPHPVQIDADGVIHAPTPTRQQTSQPQPSVNFPRLKTTRSSDRRLDGDLIRLRDDAQVAGQWNEELGEFVQASGSVRRPSDPFDTDDRNPDPFGDDLAGQFSENDESEVLAWQD